MPISVWLCPPIAARDALFATMQSVAKSSNLPEFYPHVTLIGDAGDHTPEEASSLLSKLEGAGPVKIECTEVVAEALWTQSAAAVVVETPQLIALQKLAVTTFKGKQAAAEGLTWAPPLGKPHISLAYGNAPELLATLEVPEPFVADRVAIVMTEPVSVEGVANWKEIAQVLL